MQNVVLNIEDDFLEKKLLDLSEKSKRDLNQIITDLLLSYFKEKDVEPILKYEKLNPLEHMCKPEFIDEDDDLPMTNPF